MTDYSIARHPETSGYVIGLALVVPAYALSSIDLIPHFIPLLVLLGVALVVRLTRLR